jgi:hypothetical protein
VLARLSTLSSRVAAVGLLLARVIVLALAVVVPVGLEPALVLLLLLELTTQLRSALAVTVPLL